MASNNNNPESTGKGAPTAPLAKAAAARTFIHTVGRLLTRQRASQAFISGITVLISKNMIENDIADLSGIDRSEEHTSELQSRPHLVCRLLLEKKKEDI